MVKPDLENIPGIVLCDQVAHELRLRVPHVLEILERRPDSFEIVHIASALRRLRSPAVPPRQYTRNQFDDGERPFLRICCYDHRIDDWWLPLNLEEEIKTLQRHLGERARDTDDELMKRYELRWPRRPPGLYWQLRWLVGMALRCAESLRIWRPDPWPAALRQGGASAKAGPLLIWAVGIDRHTLREACDGFATLLDSVPGFAPVLVTDVADFSFFSRLGWLVEYLPRLAGQDEPYENRKERLLARLYRGAPALPAGAGLRKDREADEVRQWLMRSA
jgi:hypothetical protein